MNLIVIEDFKESINITFKYYDWEVRPVKAPFLELFEGLLKYP